MSNSTRTLSARLRYRDDSKQGDRSGYWVPRCNVNECVQCMIEADEQANTIVHYYLLPHKERSSDLSEATVDLVILPTGKERLKLKQHGIPLIDTVELPSKQILWKQIESDVFPRLSMRQWMAALPGASSELTLSSDDDDGIADAWLWLPHHGLVVLERADRVTIDGLLKPPTAGDPIDGWKDPPQPTALPERIAGFEIWPVPSAVDTLQDLASDFGQQACNLGDANTGSDGPSEGSSTSSFKNQFQAWVLRKADKLFGDKQAKEKKRVPNKNSKDALRRPEQNTQPDRRPARKRSAFQGITASLHERLSKAIEGQREKQLQKLLDMAKNNPDEALKYAIPLAGGEAFRGLSIPGDQLLSRIPNYNFAGNGANGPVDFWHIDGQLQTDLRRAYLEMANREVAAGRHRRAAYIYANLLDDQTSAAHVLKEGHFYREAAQIYGEKLRNKPEQAKCLLAAGLCEQAVAIFLERNAYLEAAEAWESVGRLEDAQREYRREVEREISCRRILQAAKLLDHKLDAREEAKELLWKQWPAGRESLPATEEFFRMLFADGEFEAAKQKLTKAVELATDEHRLDLAVLCQRIACECPHKPIQMAARDACRVAVAECADRTSSLQMDRLMHVMQQLDPTDKLLTRDATRFKQQWQKGDQWSAPKRSIERITKESINRRTPLLLTEETCVAFKRMGDSLVVVADLITHLLVARYLPTGKSAPARSSTDAVRETSRRANSRRHALKQLGAEPAIRSKDHFSFERTDLKGMFSEDRQNADRLYFWIDGQLDQRVDRLLHDTEAQPETLRLSSRVPSALKDGVGLAWIAEGLWAGLKVDHLEWNLQTCSTHSGNLRTWSLTQFTGVFEESLGHPGMLSDYSAFLDHAIIENMGGTTVVAIANQVIVGAETRSPWTTHVGGQVHSVATPPANSRKRIAIAHSHGLDAAWPGFNGHQIALHRDRPFRHALWMQGGRLFAVSDDWLFRFHIKSGEVVSEASIQLLPDPVVALVELSPGVCGVCYRSGIVDRF